MTPPMLTPATDVATLVKALREYLARETERLTLELNDLRLVHVRVRPFVALDLTATMTALYDVELELNRLTDTTRYPEERT